jgi:hypothetical protein
VDLTLVFNDPDTQLPMATVTLLNQRCDYTPVPPQADGSADQGAVAAVGNYPTVGTLMLFLDPPAPLVVLDEPAFASFMANALVAPAAPVLLTGEGMRGGGGRVSSSPWEHSVVAALRLRMCGAVGAQCGRGAAPAHVWQHAFAHPPPPTPAFRRPAGVAAPTVSLPIGNLSITNVTIYQPTLAPGMNGLSNPPISITAVNITAADATGISIDVTLNITNPSVVSGTLGPVALDLYYGVVKVTTVALPNLVVTTGENLLVASSFFVLPDPVANASAYAATVDFLSNYLCQRTSVISMMGSLTSSPYPVLQPAFSRLSTVTVFPGLATRLLANGTLYLDTDNFNIPPVRGRRRGVAWPIAIVYTPPPPPWLSGSTPTPP